MPQSPHLNGVLVQDGFCGLADGAVPVPAVLVEGAQLVLDEHRVELLVLLHLARGVLVLLGRPPGLLRRQPGLEFDVALHLRR